MFKSVQSISYHFADLAKAKEWYSAILELKPALDSPFMVVFRLGNTNLILNASSESVQAGKTQPVVYWLVDDINKIHQHLLSHGATSAGEITTKFNISKVEVMDPFGNLIGLACPAESAPEKERVEEKPSQSANTVAFCRALAARDEREGHRGPDYLAELFLSEESLKPLQDQASREWVIKNLVTPPLYGYFYARTAWLDEIFQNHLREKIPQMVFLGAGYDTRACRFHELAGATTIYELDITLTQERKKQLLIKSAVPAPRSLVYAAINFKTDAIDQTLIKAGFDPAHKTLFIWEGVSYYLPDAVVASTLDALRRISAAGSCLCFDYMNQPLTSPYPGEPFQFWMAADKFSTFLKERGFNIVQHLSGNELEKKYLTLANGGLIAPALPTFALIEAEIRS